MLAPEVLASPSTAGRSAQRNAELIERLLAADARGGRRPGREPLREEHDRRPARRCGGHSTRRSRARIWILDDCMSAVTVPDADRPGELAVDFTPQAEAALARFAAAGRRLLSSTEPLPGPD